MADDNQAEARSPLAVLRRTIDDLDVEEKELERRLGWRPGELARVLDGTEQDSPAPYQRVWTTLLILALERWASRDADDRSRPLDPSSSAIHETAGEYDFLETDDRPAPEAGLPAKGGRLGLASLVMSRSVTYLQLELLHRLYRAGNGDQARSFEHFVQAIARLVEQSAEKSNGR